MSHDAKPKRQFLRPRSPSVDPGGRESEKYWRERFRRAIETGDLPHRVHKSEIKSEIGYLRALAGTKWPDNWRAVNCNHKAEDQE